MDNNNNNHYNQLIQLNITSIIDQLNKLITSNNNANMYMLIMGVIVFLLIICHKIYRYWYKSDCRVVKNNDNTKTLTVSATMKNDDSSVEDMTIPINVNV